MTPRLRNGLLAASLGLTLLAGACAESQGTPTRSPLSAANVIATATVRAGGVPGGTPAGGGSAGAQLFAGQGCAGCHKVQGQGGAIGPDLSNIATVAASRKPGTSAEDYIRESILNPGAFVVSGFQAGVMPATFTQLSKEQQDQLVQFLLEQK